MQKVGQVTQIPEEPTHIPDLHVLLMFKCTNFGVPVTAPGIDVNILDICLACDYLEIVLSPYNILFGDSTDYVYEARQDNLHPVIVA